MLNIFRNKSTSRQNDERFLLKKYSRHSPILKMAGWKVTENCETYGEPWFIRDFGSFQIEVVYYPMRHQYWVKHAPNLNNQVTSRTMICESPPGEIIEPRTVITQAKKLVKLGQRV